MQWPAHRSDPDGGIIHMHYKFKMPKCFEEHMCNTEAGQLSNTCSRKH